MLEGAVGVFVEGEAARGVMDLDLGVLFCDGIQEGGIGGAAVEDGDLEEVRGECFCGGDFHEAVDGFVEVVALFMGIGSGVVGDIGDSV